MITKIFPILTAPITDLILLINYSREDVRRVDCQFGIGYDANLGLLGIPNGGS